MNTRKHIYQATHNRLHYLYCRWQDEKEYEDFSEYVDAARKAIEEAGGQFLKYTKGGKTTFMAEDGKGDIKVSYTKSTLYIW